MGFRPQLLLRISAMWRNGASSRKPHLSTLGGIEVAITLPESEHLWSAVAGFTAAGGAKPWRHLCKHRWHQDTARG